MYNFVITIVFLTTYYYISTNHVSSVALGMANNNEGPSKRKRALKVSLSLYTFYLSLLTIIIFILLLLHVLISCSSIILLNYISQHH